MLRAKIDFEAVFLAQISIGGTKYYMMLVRSIPGPIFRVEFLTQIAVILPVLHYALQSVLYSVCMVSVLCMLSSPS